MKVLLAVYACSPDHGSEHLTGWNWATQLHRAGHEVWALASAVHRPAILEACRADASLQGVNWVFPEVRGWPLRDGVEPKRERTYNLLWQLEALRLARGLHRRVGFHVAHHLTWGGVRAPTFLGSLGVPLVVGPIGGGETSPRLLRAGFGLRGRAAELLRDVSNATVPMNPLLRKGLSEAALIVAKTPETKAMLPASMRGKCVVFAELSLRAGEVGRPRARHAEPPRILVAGRLIYWKGAHLAVQALEALLRRMPDATLTIVGKGPEETRLRREVASRGLADHVRLIPWLARTEMDRLYETHNLVLFPSLHDSSGNVVLEAMARGLPVVCLDLGGPRQTVTAASGVVVAVADLRPDALAEKVADEVVRLFSNPGRLESLSQGAVARAQDFLLPRRVDEFYDMVESIASPASLRAERRISRPRVARSA